MNAEYLYISALELLKKMIAIPSLSKEEKAVADLIENYLIENNCKVNRKNNNIWVTHPKNSISKKIILFNSHIDTVKPNSQWTFNPFEATIKDDKLFGLGSNDAGISVVTQMHTFLELCKYDLPYNLIYSATAEEENSGENGVESILNDLGVIDLAIVGEPTQMQMAIAEKGLLVLDCKSHGKAGHAARNEGENAIYKAHKDIEWFQKYDFEKYTDLLGKVKMTVTQINAGKQHNVVPELCEFVVDVRVNECYSNREVFEIIKQHIKSEISARSFRLNSSNIPLDHPIVKRGIELGLTHYGSPTCSDQSIMNFDTIKIGPGDSARSHTANEFVYLYEIKQGIEIYFNLLKSLKV